MRTIQLGCVLVVTLMLATAWAGGRWPWPRRIGRDVENLHLTAHKNTPIEVWPEEPASPKRASIDAARFQRAFGQLCGRMPPDRLARFSRIVLEESARFTVDPFLLGALVYDRSRCWPRTFKRDVGMGYYGLTRIPLQMHAPQIRGGVYRYYLREGDRWVERELPLEEHRYNEWTVRKAAPNLYFAAAFLHIFEGQADSLNAGFDQVPHRHFVSHWFYGDRVRQVEPENRVLRVRRRLLDYYASQDIKPGVRTVSAGEVEGIPLVSPLDGVPRLVIDYFGNKRGKKDGYGHRGIDIDGSAGEPVRAVAAGKVTFSGVDLDGARAHKILSLEKANELSNDEMGPGGLYVHINHGNDIGSIYMHLESIAVAHWEEVEAGQIIGTLGRSGTKTSGPHLHFELRHYTDRLDPAVHLSRVLVDPFAKK